MNLLVDENIMIDKIASLLPILEARGTVYFFAFAEEKEVPRWDVVISSAWSDQDSMAAVRFVVDELRPRLKPEELTLISRIAILPSDSPRVAALTKRLGQINPQDNLAIHDTLFGSDIGVAYVFKVQPAPSTMLSEQANGATTRT